MRPNTVSPFTPAAFRALLVAASFHAGVVALPLPAAQRGLVAGAIGATALLLRMCGGTHPGPGPVRIVATILIAGIAGGVVAACDRARDLPPEIGAGTTWYGWQEGVATITGTLVDCRHLPPDRIELQIAVDRVEIGGQARVLPRRIGVRVTLPRPAGGNDPPWDPGDRLRLTARLSRPRPFGNPGAFDYPAWLRARGIGLVGSVKSVLLVDRLDRERYSLTGLSARVRRSIVRRIHRAARPESAPFLAALLVGERSGIAEAIEEPLQRAGVYHIVALSGLNVVWLAGVVGFVGRLMAVGPCRRRWLVLAALAAYWWVAPGSGSMGRASLMALLYVGGQTLGRRVTPLAALGRAATLMLMVTPAWSDDPGFQLSLSATLGILIVAPVRNPAPIATAATRGIAAAASALRVSAGAMAGTLLIGAHHFHRVSAASLPANLVAVPIAAILLALSGCLAISGASPGFISGPLAAAADRLLAVLVTIADRLSSLPGLAVWVVPPPAPAAAVALAALLLGFAADRRPVRLAAGILLVGLVLATLCAGRTARPPGDLRVIALDVGQGDAILVELPSGDTMLVDAGARTRSGFDFGADVVAPAIRARGRLRLELFVVTHAHQDHLGGAIAILRQLRPAVVWVGRMPPCDPRVRAFETQAARLGIPVVSPRGGVVTRVGGVQFQVLNPSGTGPDGPALNDDSLVLRLAHGRSHLLLTGDIEGGLERRLARAGVPLEAGLLKVPHHGSRSSSTTEFLRRVRPEVAIISCGRGNPWGHPEPEVLDRLRQAGARVWRTDRDGAGCLESEGGDRWRPCDRRATGWTVP